MGTHHITLRPAALSAAYSAGLRVSEVVALKVSDIDSERLLLRIEQGPLPAAGARAHRAVPGADACQAHRRPQGRPAYILRPACPPRRAQGFRAYLASLRRIKWYVYAKPPFGGPKAVLAYLARYTHRVAISNRRLIAFNKDSVTFRYKDYRADGRAR
jgi:hypothetical protein